MHLVTDRVMNVWKVSVPKRKEDGRKEGEGGQGRGERAEDGEEGQGQGKKGNNELGIIMAFSSKAWTVLSMGPWATAQVLCPQSQPS